MKLTLQHLARTSTTTLSYAQPILARELGKRFEKQAELLERSGERRESIADFAERCRRSKATLSDPSFWDQRSKRKDFNDELQRSLEVIVHDFSSRPSDDEVAISGLLSSGYGLVFSSRLIMNHYEDLYLKENSEGLLKNKKDTQDFRNKLRFSLVSKTDVNEILHSTAEDARMFSVEKHGLQPKIKVNTDHRPIEALTIPAYVHFVLMELFKNATTAMVDRYGLLSLDTSPPIEVTLKEGSKQIGIMVSDRGKGISPSQVLHYERFLTTSVVKSEPNYHYSRAFGAPMAGLGMGIPLSKVYLSALGGTLEVSSLEGYGTSVTAIFGKFGENELL